MSDGTPKLQRRAMLTLGATFGVYALSVATHRGEFWPFSIFPMFSLAGRPWTRALMIDVTAHGDVGWGPWTLDTLPGDPVPTRQVGTSTNDMSKMIQLTTAWTDERIETLRSLWGPALEGGRTLMLLRADGKLVGDAGDVEISLQGLVRITEAAAAVNPSMRTGVGA